MGGGRVGYRDNILVIDDSSLAPPPKGAHRAVWLVRRDSATDAVQDSIPLGPANGAVFLWHVRGSLHFLGMYLTLSRQAR
jgi:hypothetical protein